MHQPKLLKLLKILIILVESDNCHIKKLAKELQLIFACVCVWGWGLDREREKKQILLTLFMQRLQASETKEINLFD